MSFSSTRRQMVSRTCRTILVLLVVGASPVAACSSSDAPPGAAAAQVDGGGSSGESTPPPITSGGPPRGDAAACQEAPHCEGDVVTACDGAAVETCASGCVEVGGSARCRSFDPSGPLTADELHPAGVESLVLDDNFLFDTDTGEVLLQATDGTTSPRRAPNAGDAFEVIDGIGYRRAADRGIFYFDTLTVRRGTPRNFVGTRPLAIVARAEIAVVGEWHLPCGKLGGGTVVDASSGGDGKAPDAGAEDPSPGGAGGGGHATAGGRGASSCNPNYFGTGEATNCSVAPPGEAGQLKTHEPWLLVGGSKGGNSRGGGGAGGAAAQLVSGGRIVIGPGTANVLAGVSVGGCGGSGTAGGGAGGTLVLESPVMIAGALSALAANGGGGGSAAIGGTGPGNGRLSRAGAPGGSGGSSCSGTGGMGGAEDNTVLGAPGATPSQSSCANYPYYTFTGGGGGGAVGTLYIVTTDAAFSERDPSFFASPSAHASFAPLTLE